MAIPTDAQACPHCGYVNTGGTPEPAAPETPAEERLPTISCASMLFVLILGIILFRACSDTDEGGDAAPGGSGPSVPTEARPAEPMAD